MKPVILAMIVLASLTAPSFAENTGLDLPLEFKQRAAVKHYNNLVIRSGQRIGYLKKIATCDPSEANHAALAEEPVMKKITSFEELPEKYHGDEGMRLISEEGRRITGSTTSLSKKLIACRRVKKSALKETGVAALADSTRRDLPLEFKQNATVKRYNLMVGMANLRFVHAEQLTNCDPSEVNIAALADERTMEKISSFRDVPEKYHGNIGLRLIAEDDIQFMDETALILKAVVTCRRAKNAASKKGAN